MEQATVAAGAAVEEKKTEEKKQEPKPVVKTTPAGILIGETLEEQWRIAEMYRRSGLLPESFKTSEMVLCAMQYCYELGLKPLTAMRQIAVINGTPSLYGDLPLGLVMGSGKAKSIKEWYFDFNGDEISFERKNLNSVVYGAACLSERNNGRIVSTYFTMEDARTAHLANKPIWKLYPRRMLKMRARSENLKDNFADLLNGVAIAEYDFDEIPEKEVEAEVLKQKLIDSKQVALQSAIAAVETNASLRVKTKEVEAQILNSVMDAHGYTAEQLEDLANDNFENYNEARL